MARESDRGDDVLDLEDEPTAPELWSRAESLLGRTRNELAASIPTWREAGFGTGVRWMERALRAVRRERVDAPSRWAEAGGALGVLSWGLGLAKYGGALLAGILLADVLVTWGADAGSIDRAWQRALAFLVVVPLVFYVVEVWLVFAFPAAIDGEQPVAESARLVSRRGALRNLPVLLGIARRMVLVRPTSLRRAWATGCLAVVVWYAYERRRAGANA